MWTMSSPLTSAETDPHGSRRGAFRSPRSAVRRTNGLQRARKLDQVPVACRLEGAAVMGSHTGLQKVALKGPSGVRACPPRRAPSWTRSRLRRPQGWLQGGAQSFRETCAVANLRRTILASNDGETASHRRWQRPLCLGFELASHSSSPASPSGAHCVSAGSAPSTHASAHHELFGSHACSARPL